jgi:hypothetical protein
VSSTLWLLRLEILLVCLAWVKDPLSVVVVLVAPQNYLTVARHGLG